MWDSEHRRLLTWGRLRAMVAVREPIFVGVRVGYSRQGDRNADEGSTHPARDPQFEHMWIERQAAGQPGISVDTKKKELVGNYKNRGSDYRPEGDPRLIRHGHSTRSRKPVHV